MNANKNYKASVFSSLFSDPDTLRELYCALEGISLPADTPVTINTLDDVLFMDRINDISFEIGGKIVVLIEHQSSINPNMALRLLMYIGRVYEKITEGKKTYSTKLLKIPRPQFFVLYNGKEPYEDEALIKLSASYEDNAFSTESLSLELEVKVININEGRNREIADKCRTLAHYSAFVAKVREYEREGFSLNEAVIKAIYYCKDHDILKEYLEKHASEVLNMLTTEWNLDDAKQVWYEEGREEGIVKGEEKHAQYVLDLIAQGLSTEEIRQKLEQVGKKGL